MGKIKNYDEEFRRNAVQLFASSGKPLTAVARDLGVAANSLRLWKKRLLGQNAGRGTVAVGGKAPAEMTAEQLVDENRRLHREIDYLKRQRDILKKAALILGEDSR
jgi:transposase-like protein